MKKLDIMKNKDKNWAIINGKVQKIEEFVKEPVVIKTEVKKELKETVKEFKKQKLNKSKRKMREW